MLNAFSVDVEDWYQVSVFEKFIPFEAWEQYENRLLYNILRLIDLLSEANVKASFFVLGWNAEHFPEVVRAIDREGHEIGTHGYNHKLVYHQTPKEFAQNLQKSIGILEDVTGKPVISHRAPSFSITERCIWAFDILGEAGIQYDSSIFPIQRRRYGIAKAPRFPHRIPLASDHSLIEFPMSTLRVKGVNVPIAGGGYLRALPYKAVRFGIEKINREGAPGVLYIHPWEIDPNQPRPRASGRALFTHRFNLGTTSQKLRHLMRDFQFAPIGELLRFLCMQDMPMHTISV